MYCMSTQVSMLHLTCTPDLLIVMRCMWSHDHAVIPLIDSQVHQWMLLVQVESLCREKGVTLPADMLEVAKQYGLRSSVLNAFFAAKVCCTDVE